MEAGTCRDGVADVVTECTTARIVVLRGERMPVKTQACVVVCPAVVNRSRDRSYEIGGYR